MLACFSEFLRTSCVCCIFFGIRKTSFFKICLKGVDDDDVDVSGYYRDMSREKEI